MNFFVHGPPMALPRPPAVKCRASGGVLQREQIADLVVREVEVVERVADRQRRLHVEETAVVPVCRCRR